MCRAAIQRRNDNIKIMYLRIYYGIHNMHIYLSIVLFMNDVVNRKKKRN